MGLQKNVSGQKIAVYAYDVAADAPKTGDAANITAQISKDYGAAAAVTDTNPTELDATDHPGVYVFDLTQAESNANALLLTPVSSTGDVVLDPIQIFTVPANFQLLSIDGSGLVNIIQAAADKVWSTTTRLLTAGTNIVLAKGTGVTGFNDLSAAQVNAEADTALADYDPPTKAELDSAVAPLATSAALATVDGIVDDILVDTAEIGAAGAGLTNINLPNQTMDIVGNITGNLSGSVGTVTAGVTLANDAITAAKFDETTAFPLKADDSGATQVARVGADGDTLETLSDQLDAKSSQASVDDLPTNAELATALGTADDAVLAQVALVKAVTDKLDDTLEDDAGTFRFTENALEEAPTGGSAPTAAAIADAVWDETLADHLGAGSTGAGLNAAGSAGDPWSTALPGAYGSGSAGKILGDNLNATVGSRATQTSVDDIPTNAELATSLAAADDPVLAAIAALNNLSQANIRTAIGLASANLDTQLDALPTNAELATALGTADDAVLAAIAGLNNLSAAQVASALATYDAPTKAELDAAVALLATAATLALVKAKTDSLTFTQAGHVDANVQRVNDVALDGAGTSGSPWRPAA
jgi:hypothetical protein